MACRTFACHIVASFVGFLHRHCHKRPDRCGGGRTISLDIHAHGVNCFGRLFYLQCRNLCLYNWFVHLSSFFLLTSDAVPIGSIIYQILHVAKGVGNCQNRLRNTARIVADSGFLYTLVTVIYVAGLLLYEKNSRMSVLHNVFDALVSLIVTFFGCVLRVLIWAYRILLWLVSRSISL